VAYDRDFADWLEDTACAQQNTFSKIFFTNLSSIGETWSVRLNVAEQAGTSATFKPIAAGLPPADALSLADWILLSTWKQL
jgi:hypothetical protein